MSNKTKLVLIIMAVVLLAVIVVIASVVIWARTPGVIVNSGGILQHVGDKVTIQGVLGDDLGLVQILEGGELSDYYEEYSFLPADTRDPADAILLRFKSYQFPGLSQGDLITVTGVVYLDGDEIYIDVIRIKQ